MKGDYQMGDIIKERAVQLLEDIEETQKRLDEIIESTRIVEEELFLMGPIYREQ
jgi:hypothetical protein